MLDEIKLLEAVDAVLGPKGLLVTRNGFVHSEAQHDYARRAARGFCRRDNSDRASLNVLQAGTGTGKTVGYLVPAMLYAAMTGSRVAISTFTRHLQTQVLQDATTVAEVVREVTNVVLDVCLRQGRQNFASSAAIRRMIDLLAAEDGNDAAEAFLSDLFDWVEAVEPESGHRLHSGLISDFLEEQGLDAMPYGLSAASLGLSPEDADDLSAAYEAQAAVAREADVVIVNHALLFAHALRWGALLDGSRQLSVLIADEADRLPDAAESVLNADLPLHVLTAVMRQIAGPLGQRELISAADALWKAVMAVRPDGARLLQLNGSGQQSEGVRVALRELSALIVPLASKVKGPQSQHGQGALFAASVPAALLDRFLDLARGVEDMYDALASGSDGIAVVSWSPVRAYPSLRRGRAEPARLLSRLWNRYQDSADNGAPSYLDAALFTSATLAAPGQELPGAFDDFLSAVGVRRHAPASGQAPTHYVQGDLFAMFEPAVFGRLSVVLPSPAVPNPQAADDEALISDPDWLDYNAAMIRAATTKGGRVLVLTSSFRDAESLADRLDLPGLLVQKVGQPLSDLVSRFKLVEQSVLITPAGWEGLNLPGLIRHLVIPRIPFRHPDSLSEALYALALQKRGKSQDIIDGISYRRLFNGALRKLAQGLGRPIRRMTDQATVWIGDPRFPLPERIESSLLVAKMEAPKRRSMKMMARAFPTRFRLTAYERDASIALWDRESQAVVIKAPDQIF